MRAPRILIWASARDRNSRLPSPGWRTRSPVRYRRCPGRDGSGSATNRPAVRPGRPRYPRATPTPLIYSSPPAPAGTGTSPSSRILSPTDGSGVPIGRCRRSSSPAPAGSRKNVELHVASVTPYTFISGTPSLRHIASRSGSTRSLPTITSRSDDGSARPARSSSRTHSCQYAAGSSITLTCSRPASSARSARCSPGRPGGHPTTPPPPPTRHTPPPPRKAHREQLLRQHVKPRRRELQEPAPRPQLQPLPHLPRERRQRPVLHHHALRLTRRPRRVHHVRRPRRPRDRKSVV